MSPTHWLIVIGVVVLLFGAKRLPDAARSLGRSARILKAEVRETREEGVTDQPATTAPAPALDRPAVPVSAPEKQPVTQPSS